MNVSSQNWSKEVLKRRVRFAYGDSLSAEDRNDGYVPVFGSNGIVGTHDRSITYAPAIIIGRKGSAGRVTWSNVPCFPIDTTYFVDRTQTRENMRWLFYALESLELEKINFDSAVPGLSRELAYSLPLIFPPLHEQEHIADYLDKTCATIDTAIEKKQKQLERLDALRKSIIHKAVTRGLDDSVELKDSGVEWIGRVPKHWKPFRIKDVAQLSPDFSNGKPNATDLCTVIPMEAVSENGQIDISNIEKYDLITNGLTNFEVGDVIFAKITPCMENGKGAYVESLPTRYAFGSTEFHVLRPRHVVNGKFLYYYTFNSIYRDYAEANMSGAAGQKRVSSRFINYTKINLPSKDEQAQIVDYLDNAINRFNELGVNLKNQIATLEQYRKSLIHECVTGKQRITEAYLKEIETHV